MYPQEYVSTSTKDFIEKDHKIRVGIEPTSSDNRSAVLPLNYPIFSPVIRMTAYSDINLRKHKCNRTVMIIDIFILTLIVARELKKQ
jgi:hypothetical protein